MKNIGLDFIVGLFVITGAALLLYMSVSIGGASLSDAGQYSLIARFENTSGLKEGAFVEVSGVRVGQARSIVFDPESYESVVEIVLDESINVPDDSIASIRTAGIIGDRFIKITPGGSDLYMAHGEEFLETEPSISLEELISKYMFSNE
jgi:phospholipid/cholesterol/gamma-HCH transport system substrate-binding protein